VSTSSFLVFDKIKENLKHQQKKGDSDYRREHLYKSLKDEIVKSLHMHAIET